MRGDLVEVECVNREDDFKLFLLGSENHLIVIDFQKDESGITFYVILILLVIAAAAACKFLLFTNKEEVKALSEEGGQENYKELKDVVKNEQSDGQNTK